MCIRALTILLLLGTLAAAQVPTAWSHEEPIGSPFIQQFGIGDLVVLNGNEVWLAGWSDVQGGSRVPLLLESDGVTWSPSGFNTVPGEEPESIQTLTAWAGQVMRFTGWTQNGGQVVYDRIAGNWTWRNSSGVAPVIWRDAMPTSATTTLSVGTGSTGAPTFLTTGIVSRDDGTLIQNEAIPLPIAGGTSEFHTIAGTGPQDVWVGGCRRASPGTGPAQTFMVHYDGQAWTEFPTPSPGTDDCILDLSAPAINDVWAVGTTSSGGLPQSLVMHWDGQSWTVHPMTGWGVFAVLALGPQDIYLGANGVYHGDGTAFGLLEDFDLVDLQINSLAREPVTGTIHAAGRWGPTYNRLVVARGRLGAAPSSAQPSRPGLAAFDLNCALNSTAGAVDTGEAGPFEVAIGVGATMDFDFESRVAFQALICFHGPLNPAAATYPGEIGQIDVGGPGLDGGGIPVGLTIFGDGLAGGGFDALFVTGPAAQGALQLIMPDFGAPPGTILTTMQCFILDPAPPFGRLSNAITIRVP